MRKNYFLFSICTILISAWGCSEYNEFPFTEADDLTENVTRATSYLYEDAVYHEATGSWICPRRDPYTLENFQNAYDNLITKNYVLPISLSSASNNTTDRSLSIKLQATHYNIKIYPKTEDEQYEIELLDDVAVAYIPFDYIQLPESETKNLMPGQAVYPEQGRYTVTYEGFMSEYGPVEPETITLPVLYAVWPCNKAIPAGTDYEILYEVFLPEYYQNARTAGLSSDIITALEKEALILASDEKQSMAVADWGQLIPIATDAHFYHHDDRLNKDVPLEGLKIRFQNGSNVKDDYTDSNGRYNLGLFVNIGEEPTLSIIFESDKWKITNQSETATKVINLGVVSNYRGVKTAFYPSQFDQPLFEIHRAVNFYYNGVHYAPRVHYASSQIRIRALNFEDSRFAGQFSYSVFEKPYITICRRKDNNHSKEIGTTLHELGHFTQYIMKGGTYAKFNKINARIKESWASYAGWYIGETYYKSLGHTITPGSDITGQARQGWEWTSGSDYSPLFVDLVDKYNQSINNLNNVTNDIISNVSYSIMNDLGRNASDFESFKELLIEYIGNNYSLNTICYYLSYFHPNKIDLYPKNISNKECILHVTLGRGLSGNTTIKLYNSGVSNVITINIPNAQAGSTVSIDVSKMSIGMLHKAIVQTATGADQCYFMISRDF